MAYKNYNDYELMYLISENNEDAYQTIFEKYEPLIFKEAVKYFFFTKDLVISREDIIEEGKIGLYKAIKKYNDDVEFYTFAYLCIKRNIQKLLAKCETNKQKSLNDAISINESNDNIINKKLDGMDLLQILIDREFETKIIKFKNQLQEIEANIFELKYNGFSYKEIGILMHLTKKEVDNKLLSIRKKLKKYLKEIK